VHLRLDDIYGAGAAVAQTAQTLEVVHRDQTGEDSVEQAFRRFRAIGEQHGGIGHQMADIANKHQAAARQGERRAIGIDIVAVRVGLAFDRPAALVEGGIEIAAHQTQPVAVGQHLVLGIDGGNRIFHIDDGSQGRFQQHVGDMGGIVLADRMAGVKDHVDMEAIVTEQAALVALADILRGVLERNARFLHVAQVSPFAIFERHGFVEKRLCRPDHMCAALRIIAARFRGRCIQRIGAVKGIIEAAPAGIGGIEDEAVIERGHDQLRPGHGRDFRVHILGPDRKRARFFNQITDIFQKRLIRTLIHGLALMILVPGVNLCLQRLPLFQKLRVERNKFAEQMSQILPEFFTLHAGPRQGAVIDKIKQLPGDLDSVLADIFGHAIPSTIISSRPQKQRGPRPIFK